MRFNYIVIGKILIERTKQQNEGNEIIPSLLSNTISIRVYDIYIIYINI